MMELDEPLYEHLAALISGEPCPEYWPKFLQIQEFTLQVNKFITPELIEFTLNKDMLINDLLIEAGSDIKITKNKTRKSNHILECDMDEFNIK